jgi:hypothetical protein
VRLSRFVAAIIRLAHEPPAGGRPATLWLAGSYHEGSTTGPASVAGQAPHLADGAGPAAYR